MTLDPAFARRPVGTVDRALKSADLKPVLEIDRQAVLHRPSPHTPSIAETAPDVRPPRPLNWRDWGHSPDRARPTRPPGRERAAEPRPARPAAAPARPHPPSAPSIPPPRPA